MFEAKRSCQPENKYISVDLNVIRLNTEENVYFLLFDGISYPTVYEHFKNITTHWKKKYIRKWSSDNRNNCFEEQELMRRKLINEQKWSSTTQMKHCFPHSTIVNNYACKWLMQYLL